jgi:hypothetical protein
MKRIFVCTFIMLALAIPLTMTVEEAFSADPAEEVRKAKAAGFVALSESSMNWEDAKAFCQKHGGRLPLINNSASWDGQNPQHRGIPIDGFGFESRPWSEVGLPNGYFWTGTEASVNPGLSRFVLGDGGTVHANVLHQGAVNRVVCVP